MSEARKGGRSIACMHIWNKVCVCSRVCVCVCVSRTHLYALLVILDFRIKFDTIIDVLCLANTDMENMDYSGEDIDCLKCL